MQYACAVVTVDSAKITNGGDEDSSEGEKHD